MTKRVISMCVVLALIAGLAGVYFWQIQAREGNGNENELPALQTISLIQRDQEEIREIVVYRNDKRSTLRPSRIGGEIVWTLMEAGGHALHPARLQDKARPGWVLTALEVAHEDTAVLDLSEFGLSPPQITMEISYTDGTGHTLRLGGQTADMQRHFLMIDDDSAMYLISSLIAERMLFGLEDMLDTRLPEFHFEAAYYIRISQRGNPAIRIGWPDEAEIFPEMIEPYPGMDLDIQGISDSILSPLGALQIGNLVEFHAENPADFGFDNPLLEFEFVSVPGHGLMDTFLVFGDIFEQDGIDYIYVRFADRPHVFKTQLWQIDSLLDIHIFDILQRFIALIDIRDVERVIIDSAENSFEMVMNHSGDFSELDPTINDMPIEERVFRIAYRTLISTSADADIPLFAPEGEPAVTITFYRIDNPDTELRFFEFDVNFFAVSVDGEDAWFVSGRRQIDLLFSHLHELLAD